MLSLAPLLLALNVTLVTCPERDPGCKPTPAPLPAPAAGAAELSAVRAAIEEAQAAAQAARAAADEARKAAAEAARATAAVSGLSERQQDAAKANSARTADYVERASDAARAAAESANAAEQAAKAANEAATAAPANTAELEARIQNLETRLSAAEASLDAATAAPEPPSTRPVHHHAYGHARKTTTEAPALTPLRSYLANDAIPPDGVGGYGVIVLQAKATQATRAKLMKVCRDFLSFFPTAAGSQVPAEQQMVTIWPVEQSFVDDAAKDNCDFDLQHYDLIAAENAIRDATRQGAKFDGEGPYLVGWAPSDTRGVPDQLVLVVDLSRSSTQDEIDHDFLFWKQKIVEDPEAWTSGFSMERFRLGVADFADRYGEDIIAAFKLVSAKDAK